MGNVGAHHELILKYKVSQVTTLALIASTKVLPWYLSHVGILSRAGRLRYHSTIQGQE